MKRYILIRESNNPAEALVLHFSCFGNAKRAMDEMFIRDKYLFDGLFHSRKRQRSYRMSWGRLLSKVKLIQA